ncbi:hypothetical protein M2277_006338 [Paenibacillus sp. LBL]|uniref:hypothetical protein n=1 Tax=Paenibacillus sp. LBL TaxID=2940563 RepID=UPI0024751AD5|nr:hypothetical protein [Paenibacillus sp. LBL]MDH6675630.1 hypothetical protein [Paenibacillus sp. LBL]
MKISYISHIFPKFKKALLVARYIDSGSKVDRYVRNYSLQGKTLSLLFFHGNCHKVADPAGRCSLFLEDQGDLSNHREYEKANPKHCPYIHFLMQNESDRMFPPYNATGRYPIYLCRNSCGHYSTGQGQHRLCISGTLGIPLPRVRLSSSENVCGSCENPHTAMSLYSF